jgi:hypothetical protein
MPADPSISIWLLNRNRGGYVEVLVKYSHHANGYAHFPQTGRTNKALHIHKNATPLSDHRGHMFTLHVKGFADFKTTQVDVDSVTPVQAAKRTPFVFHFPAGDTGVVKFIGGWGSIEDVYANYAWSATDGVVGPLIVEERLTGPAIQRVLLAPHQGTPSASRVLVLRCSTVPYESATDDGRLVMLAGFDPIEVINDRSKSTSMMAFRYPAATWENLRESIPYMGLRAELAGQSPIR